MREDTGMSSEPAEPAAPAAPAAGTVSPADPRFSMILEELSRDDSISASVLERGRRRFPAYASVPTESLIEAVERNRALAIQTLRTGVIPAPEQIWEAALSTSERLAQGLSITDIMGGFRESLKVIQSRVLEMTRSRGFSPEVALQASTLLWDLGDTFSARISLAYREIQIESEVAQQQEREQWIRRLLAGELTEMEQQSARARMHGLGPVKAVVTEPLAVPAPFALPRTLFLDQGRAVGYLGADEHLPERVSYSEGPTVDWSRLPDSYRLAQQLRAAAEFMNIEGKSTTESLSWRVGVPCSGELNDALRRKYVDPVLAEGEFGEHIIESIRAFLDHNLKINAAAEHLPVHPNTLRYRMQKFEEITGASLDHFETLIEIAWVLAAIPQPGRSTRA